MNLIDRIRNHSSPPPIVAELSGNHNKQFHTARSILDKAASAGAAAIKLQTYTADSLTLPATSEEFIVKGDLWDGQSLYDLYSKASTPYDWHKPLAEHAAENGIECFSTPFDEAAVDFLEESISPNLYKISSFEINHLPLLKKVAQTKKPVLMSTGMATNDEIAEALDALRSNGCPEVVLLKCVSAYPSDPHDFNLRGIEALQKEFDCLVGLSDHCLTNEVAIAAVALGVRVIEKHVTDCRDGGGVDAGFSLEPNELAALVRETSIVHAALGTQSIGATKQDSGQLQFRRSIYVSKPIASGAVFTTENVKIIRPSLGLAPKLWETVLGKTASRGMAAGTPLKASDVNGLET